MPVPPPAARTRRRVHRRGTKVLTCAALVLPFLVLGGSGAAAQQATPAGPVCTDDVPPANHFVDRHEVPLVHRASADCAGFLRIALGTPVDSATDIRRTALQPAADVTRAAMASFVARTLLVAGVGLPPASSETFDDVEPGSTHEQAIQRLRAADVVSGRTPTAYAPDAPVTRGQTASLLLRAAAHARQVDPSTLERADSPFTDVADSVHAPAVAGAHALGFVRGVTPDRFAPGATTSRAQMTSLLVRALESEVQPVRPCVNEQAGYTVRPPATWTAAPGDGSAPCSAFAPGGASGTAIVLRDEPTPFEESLSPGAGAVLEQEQRVLLGSHRAVVQERRATGAGPHPEGLRSTLWFVERGDRTLVGETRDVAEQEYRANSGVLARMLLSLELHGADGQPFVPPDAQETSPVDGAGLGLVEVRTGRHAGYDRVVLELAGEGTVGWRVAYTDDPRFAGTGDPVEVAGAATLQIVVDGVGYPTDTGVPAYDGPLRVDGPGEAVEEVVVGALYEGLQGVFAGTSDELPFRVLRLSDPERLVVDIAHQPAD